MKEIIKTVLAPEAIGPYSQAVKVDRTVYFSGQIPLDPKTMTLVGGDIEQQAHQVFVNLQEVAKAAGGDLSKLVKLTVYLTDLTQFSIFNTVMERFFQAPFPARTTVQVSALPKAAQVEVEAIMMLD